MPNVYLDVLERELIALGYTSLRRKKGLSGILSVQIPHQKTAEEATKVLGDNGIACSTPDGKLRFSPHWPNSLDEIEAIVDGCQRLLQ